MLIMLRRTNMAAEQS